MFLLLYFTRLTIYIKTNIKQKISNKVLNECIIKFMKLMIPFIPHLAHECLTFHNCRDVDVWPQIEKNTLEEVKIAIQINGKTKDVISIKKDLGEEEVIEHCFK